MLSASLYVLPSKVKGHIEYFTLVFFNADWSSSLQLRRILMRLNKFIAWEHKPSFGAKNQPHN